MAEAVNSPIIPLCYWRYCFTAMPQGFSSRNLEQATYDLVKYRFITGDTTLPDHETIAVFRKRFLAERKGMFV